MIDLKQFAESRRLKLTRDKSDDTGVISGKNGQIYEYSEEELGIMFVTPVNRLPRTHFWRKVSAACLGAGMTMRQQGDAEGALSFDPNNQEQVRLAMKLAGVRPKRRMSEEQRLRMTAVLADARKRKLRPYEEREITL